MVQVRRPSCLGAARGDPSGIQLAVAFRIVSTHNMHRSLRHPFGHYFYRIRRVRHRFRTSNCARRRPSPPARLLGLLAPYLDFALIPDTSGAAVSLPCSSGSSGTCLGEFSSPLRSNRSLTCSDVFLGFFDTHIPSSSQLGTPDARASSSVNVSSKLGSDLSSSSSRPRGSFCRFAGSLVVVKDLGDILVRS